MMKYHLGNYKYECTMNAGILIFLTLMLPLTLMAQTQKEKPTVTYEEIYDEPYSINKLFVAFQPLYGELFATNVNSGFGVEASYYHKDKMDFKVNFRKTYSSEFFDFNRNASLKAQNDPAANYISDVPQLFDYFEIGGTYHIKDFDQDSKTKMVLYKKSLKGDRWAATVPLHAEVPCKVRKIYGARLGGIVWNSTADLSRALAKQKLTNADLTNSSGVGLPQT